MAIGDFIFRERLTGLVQGLFWILMALGMLVLSSLVVLTPQEAWWFEKRSEASTAEKSL